MSVINPMNALEVVYDDGGRADAGYRGSAGDCVTRAIAIATERPYAEVYKALFDGIRTAHRAKHGVRRGSPRNGVRRKVFQKYLESLGWRWVPTMKIGSGCKVHLCAGELPAGRLIVSVSKHLVAVIDHVIHDTSDPQWWTITTENGVQRAAARCVYGYFVAAAQE